jgi:hypothetical protein
MTTTTSSLSTVIAVAGPAFTNTERLARPRDGSQVVGMGLVAVLPYGVIRRSPGPGWLVHNVTPRWSSG